MLSDTEWKQYASPNPDIHFIGTITRKGVTGALGLQSGMYCCVIDGHVEHLIQSKVKAAVENSEVRE